MNTANLPGKRLSVNVLYCMDLLILLSFSRSFTIDLRVVQL